MIHTVNLERGMPSTAKARIQLDQALRTARAGKAAALKIIHGYGSSGCGGAIKKDVQAFLSAKLREGAVRGFVPGERFTPFDAQARAMIDLCPELSKDRDYSRGNDGVTVVLL